MQMANQDYFNLESMNPAGGAPGGWRPEGAAAGMEYYDRKFQYDKMMGLKQLMMEMDEQKQRGTLKDWNTARPSALASTIATNEAETGAVGPRKAGEALSTKVKGDYDFGTLNSRINDLLDSNDEKKRERGLKAITQGMQVMDLLGPAIETGDHDLVRSLAKGAGVKDTNPMIEHILKSQNPAATLKTWRSNFEAAQGRSEAGKIDRKGGFDIREREIMADAQKFTAYMHLLAAQFRTGSQQAKEKIESLLARTTQAWFDEKNPTKKAELLEKVNTLNQMILGMRAAGAPYSRSELGADVMTNTPPNAAGAPARRAGAFPPIPPLQGGQPPVPTSPITKEQVEGAGEQYQPDRYDYEMQNGRLMKRAK
jgi:hypothetical protein